MTGADIGFSAVATGRVEMPNSTGSTEAVFSGIAHGEVVLPEDEDESDDERDAETTGSD